MKNLAADPNCTFQRSTLFQPIFTLKFTEIPEIQFGFKVPSIKPSSFVSISSVLQRKHPDTSTPHPSEQELRVPSSWNVAKSSVGGNGKTIPTVLTELCVTFESSGEEAGKLLRSGMLAYGHVGVPIVNLKQTPNSL